MLTSQNELYGSHICGEGGEYETLTLDCPLFKRRITLYVKLKNPLFNTYWHWFAFLRAETETVIHSDNDFATVAFLRIKAAKHEDRPEITNPVAIPPLLDEDYSSLESVVSSSENNYKTEIQPPTFPTSNTQQPNIPILECKRIGAWVSVSNIQIYPSESPVTIEEEVAQCFRMLASEHLYQLRMFVSSVNFCLQNVSQNTTCNCLRFLSLIYTYHLWTCLFASMAFMPLFLVAVHPLALVLVSIFLKEYASGLSALRLQKRLLWIDNRSMSKA